MAVLEIVFDAGEIAALQQALQQSPEIVTEEMHTFMTGATAYLLAEVQEGTPTADGTLRASIFGEVSAFSSGFGVQGLVSSPLGYAPAVEYGTRPHHPPIEPLVEWARKKLALSGTEARSAAFAIAKKIARVGTEPAHMFTNAFNAGRRQIEANFRASVARILARIGGSK